MITFLRKIRKALIGSGEANEPSFWAGKYLIYAFGEILLVMIGILLALQVNNWNEARKNAHKVTAVLNEIRQNTAANIEIMEGVIRAEQSVIASIDIVENHLSQNHPYHDSLDSHFLFSFFLPGVEWQTSGFQTLQSLGVDLIESGPLRQVIVELYQSHHNVIMELTRLSEGIHESVNQPIIVELFDTYSYTLPETLSFGDNYDRIYWAARPFDYDQVRNTDRLKGALGQWKYYRTASIEQRKWVIRKSQEVVDLIDEELGLN